MEHLVEATSADLETLAVFVNGAYRSASAREGWTHEADLLGGQRTDPELLAEMIVPPSAVLMLREDGAIRACVHVKPKQDQRFYFGMLAVEPSRQGRGLGRRMVEAVEARARGSGCTFVEMTVIPLRHTLIAWYEQIGYRQTGAVEPFPYGNHRYGLPRRDDLSLVLFEKRLR